MRLLMPCLHDRLADVESVLEVVLRMLRGSEELTLLFVHIAQTGQAELLRQQGRLLLRLLVARGIQVVWHETEDPSQFAVLQSEIVTQRATHVVLPMDGMPASWAEQITTLTIPLLLVRPEEQKEKNPEDAAL